MKNNQNTKAFVFSLRSWTFRIRIEKRCNLSRLNLFDENDYDRLFSAQKYAEIIALLAETIMILHSFAKRLRHDIDVDRIINSVIDIISLAAW